MIPFINTIHADIANRLLGIFFDIDETFTTHGRIHSAAFRSLWKLKDAGLYVVPITGRSAGWCDHIARMWPVDGIVGENGGFYFWFEEADRKLKKRFCETEDIRAERRQRLALRIGGGSGYLDISRGATFKVDSGEVRTSCVSIGGHVQ